MSISFPELHFGGGKLGKNQGSPLEAKGFGEFCLMLSNECGRDHKCLAQQYPVSIREPDSSAGQLVKQGVNPLSSIFHFY